MKRVSRELLLGSLLLGTVACGEVESEAMSPTDTSLAQVANAEAEAAERVEAQLAPATDCADLLARVQGDAIAKVKTQVAEVRQQGPRKGGTASNPSQGGARPPAAPGAARPGGVSRAADSDASTGPVGASETNKQVEGIDEADFVKVVQGGRAIYLLHGSTLRKLKSWPAPESALQGKALLIEGRPSEMFVTDAGTAVIFSSVNGYATTDETRGRPTLKVTVVDVTTDAPRAVRELYFEGSYVSARRYQREGTDAVRVVVSSRLKYNGAFPPSIQYTDPWGRPYDQKAIDTQLAEWESRTIAAIRDTQLNDWLPNALEAVNGKIEVTPPNCRTYYAPAPGVSGFGMTQVLGLDLTKIQQPVSMVTIVGGSNTVYSNAQHLVLAQPDQRFNRFAGPSRQRTALHAFTLSALETQYAGSGWVPGGLPANNAQFGLDVTGDGTLRVVTTGWVQTAKDHPEGGIRWESHTENQLITARSVGGKLVQIGRSPQLGHDDETVQSARFVGNRAYVVTYRSIDPLIVLDVRVPEKPTVLGEIAIPGFSTYMHPLDENHLITVGQSGRGGSQLQLFDVTSPLQIPKPLVLDFGDGTQSGINRDHKAFTMYKDLLAIPVAGTSWLGQRRRYSAALELVRVDVQKGFTPLGEIEHAGLYADNGAGILCGYCDKAGCFDYSCPYEAEIRRGAFVEGTDKTFVYSFSNAGILVNDLSALAQPVARIGLPAPIESAGPWYDVSAVSKVSAPTDEEPNVDVPRPPTATPLPGTVTPGRPVAPTAPDAIDEVVE